MELDLGSPFGAFGVGTIVSLTGMGGGGAHDADAGLLFGVPPLAANFDDLLASAIMRTRWLDGASARSSGEPLQAG
jgi:hypothetical protein